MMTGRTALVLSGGGSLGAVQVGMLKALSRIGFLPDMVVGASVGALNGAAYAEDPTPAGVDRLAELWHGLSGDRIFPLSWTTGIKALLQGHDHLVEADTLRALIYRALRIRRIEEAQIPLHVTATDVLSGEAVLLSSGEVGTVLGASAAIPVVFPHVQIGDRFLMDGGVAENTPIASAVQLGAERLIVLPTGMSCALSEPPRHMVALALHIVGLHSMRQLDRDVQRFEKQVEITIVPPLCPLGTSPFDFSQTVEMIARADHQTRNWLAAEGLGHHGALNIPLAHQDRPDRPRLHGGEGAHGAAM